MKKVNSVPGETVFSAASVPSPMKRGDWTKGSKNFLLALRDPVETEEITRFSL